MIVRNILVFPCGSEIGLEVFRSVRYSSHFNLIGGSSVDDHGKFVFSNYIGDIPFVDSPFFIKKIKEIVRDKKIDAIYPTMDSVIAVLKKHEKEIGCHIVSSDVETVEICLSKSKTYKALGGVVKTPKVFEQHKIDVFPVFAKPDIGYGSRGVRLISSKRELEEYNKENSNVLYCEYLPGDEYTVDCFTDKNGKLMYYSPRERRRIQKGISVNTMEVSDNDGEFKKIVKKINDRIKFRGAWFVQLKRDENEVLTILEIAARFGGSSSLSRAKGVNFSLLSLYDAFGCETKIIPNNYVVELDRALNNKYKIDLFFDEVFVDFDDCIIIKEEINTNLISFIFQCISRNIKITLLTRHKNNIETSLKKYRILNIFDRIIHIRDTTPKSHYIDNENSILIDDSFAERQDVWKNKKIAVFSPDMVECLIN